MITMTTAELIHEVMESVSETAVRCPACYHGYLPASGEVCPACDGEGVVTARRADYISRVWMGR